MCVICAAGCASTREVVVRQPAERSHLRVAVLPITNLSGRRAPLADMRKSLAGGLKSAGLSVLDEKTLEAFMARHRVRYTGGVDSERAAAFGKETGVDAILVTSLDFYSSMQPPKISLVSRLISASDAPEVIWTGQAALSGDDSPGLLGIHLISDPHVLQEKALGRLAESLGKFLASGKEQISSVPGRYKPKIWYRSPVFSPGARYKILVLPFYNRSDRKNAGEMLQMKFADQLRRTGNFEVVEPGVIRHELLTYRIIMEEGVSLAQADILFANLRADLILAGYVFRCEDEDGSTEAPKVDFSALVIDKKNRKTVWASDSFNTGNDGVFFFDMGRISTAATLASEMARGVVEAMEGEGPERGTEITGRPVASPLLH